MKSHLCLALLIFSALVSGRAAETVSHVSITVEGDYRFIRANGLPDHPTGQFPGRGNPNRISAQTYVFRVPVTPKPAAQPAKLGLQAIGVAVNGVVFDPGANEWWNDDRSTGWQYEALGGGPDLGLDASHAHVQPTGAYHYHGIPVALLNRLSGGKPAVVLLGWAADGFPIYGPWGAAEAKDARSEVRVLTSSYRIKAGARTGGPGGNYDGKFVQDYEYVAGAGDLDECNGRFAATPEYPAGIYHYVLTTEYPFIPRMLKGTADASFARKGPPGAPPSGPRKQRPQP
jgi:hypothetical protein